MKRLFDLILPLVLAALLVKLTSEGPVLYWSDRVGRNNRVFRMPKSHPMRMGTPAVATHLLVDPALHLTRVGGFLRKSSLDELPQLRSLSQRRYEFCRSSAGALQSG